MFGTVGRIFLALGVLIAVVTGVIVTGFLLDERSRADWGSTTGTVVALVRSTTSTTSSNEPMYSERVTYSVAGREHTTENPSASTDPEPVGQQVEVRYDPLRPDEARIGPESHFAEILLSVVGLLFLIGFGGAGRSLIRTPDAPPTDPR